MKQLLLLSLLLAIASPAPALADDRPERKTERKSRSDKKDDEKDAKKETVRNLFEVTVVGAKDEAAENDVRTFLASIEGVKLESSSKTEDGISAVLSTETKISRADVAKALKDNKDLKISEFKAVRPGRTKKDDPAKPDASKEKPAK